MRIPRNIEWRAGVILVGATMIFLGLLIILTLARTDVGLEAGGVMRPTSKGWTLTVEVPGERLGSLQRIRYARFRSVNERAWYGKIVGIEGCLSEDRPSVIAVIDVQPLDATGVPDDFYGTVHAMLIEERDAPVLRVLFESISNRPGI